MKYNIHCTSDNFLQPVKIQPLEISLEEIHTIAREFSFRFPNFYFYEKENIIPGWLLITGNYLLRLFRSRQPVWRLLILLKRIEQVLGIALIKRSMLALKMKSNNEKNRISNGFSLLNTNK
jgi:hypothetical protein